MRFSDDQNVRRGDHSSLHRCLLCLMLSGLVIGMLVLPQQRAWGQQAASGQPNSGQANSEQDREPVVHGQDTETYRQRREQMIEESIKAAGVTDPRVLKAMRETLRHEFVAEKYRVQAYDDIALPIGGKQTISGPFIVAYMTECLDPQPDDRVLEIGTGSGYQAAVLSPLVQDVYTIEIVEELGRSAKSRLQRLNYQNVHAKVGDGFQGWPEHAPFDKMIVTCSPEKVPEPLVEQLREGGLIIIPVGERHQQTLYLMRKKEGRLVKESLRPTLFVPMTGTAESRREIKPDPARPSIVNGSFERKPNESGFVPAWYYQRLCRQVRDTDAPDGDFCIEFSNDRPGLSSHCLQGFAIDGRRVSKLKVSAWVKLPQVKHGESPYDIPVIAVSFYGQNRNELDFGVVGPFPEKSGWVKYEKTFRVPVSTREGLFRVGLFGATGTMRVDDLEIKAVRP